MAGIKPEKRLHVHVEGQVQGVGFRYFVLETAQSMNLIGWVRNTYRGEVELVAEGSQEQLERLLRFVQRGPAMSYVTNTRVSWEEPTGDYDRFQVITSL
jgi:acylphosphatase